MDTHSTPLRRAVFLDRDGVICANRPDHVKNWSEFHFLPGVTESLAVLASLELPIIVISNQAIVNRKIVPVEVVTDMHRRMVETVVAAGGRIDAVLFCPHRPDEGCDCRKPKPGLLWQAAQNFRLKLNGSYLVGDAATDIIAGNQVGCRTFLVLTGRGPQQLAPAFRAVRGRFTVVENLMEAVVHIAGVELTKKGESVVYSYGDVSAGSGAEHTPQVNRA